MLYTNADRSVWPLVEPVKRFTETHLNDVPAAGEIEPSLRAIKRLRDALSSQNPSPGLRDFAESALARAAEVFTRRGADLPAEALSVARTVLLQLRSHRLSAPTRDREPYGIKTIPPGPRGDVPRGLLQLARADGYCDQETRTAIKTLAEDPVPWVRYSVARYLPLLRHVDPERMWGLLRHIAQRDSSDRVLAGVVRAAWALRNDADAAVDVIRLAAEHVTPTGQHDSALEACTEAAGLIWVLDGLPAAGAILKQLTDLQAYGPGAPIALLSEIRSARALTLDDDAIRGRALRLCQQLTEVGFAAVGDLGAKGSHPTEDEQVQIRAGIELLDAVAAQLYYVSGAFDARRGGAEAAASAPAQIRLVEESHQMIVQLGSVPVPRITHHLVEVLEHVLDQRPEVALLTTRDILVSGGQAGYYQQDPMAIDTMVRIVERILAAHRGILRLPENLTALRQLLDVFVEAGWPAAHRLAFGLEHIFR